MSTWVLFLVLWTDGGGVSVVESLEFTREGSCKSAALYATSKPVKGIKKINAVCKKTTNV